MKRTAIVTPSSLGALGAYRTVIKDISAVLGDPAIDVAKLFFAVMIQSGLDRFGVADEPTSDVLNSSLLTDRVCPIDYSRVADTLRGVREAIVRSSKSAEPSRDEQHILYGLAGFVEDLYLAAEYKRPVATVLDMPAVQDASNVLRDDMAIVIEALLKEVRTIDVQAPVARFDVQESDMKAFRAVMASDVFEPYVGSQALFEIVSRPTGGVVEAVAVSAKSIVRAFPNTIDLRKTLVHGIESVPAILDSTIGKAFGAVAKPIADALTSALGNDRRLLVYSFWPTWRRIWEAKLDKVRVIVANEKKSTAL